MTPGLYIFTFYGLKQLWLFFVAFSNIAKKGDVFHLALSVLFFSFPNYIVSMQQKSVLVTKALRNIKSFEYDGFNISGTEGSEIAAKASNR